jgi:uncharacterized protein YndB with AHSA1/START domain
MMTDKHGRTAASGELIFKRFFNTTIENLWAYLTESEKRGKWLASGEMELHVGGAVHLHFMHSDLSPLPGSPPEMHKAMEAGHHFTGEITRIDPPHLLAFTWQGDSEVTFELSPQENGVLLLLTHRKLDNRRATRLNVSGGWHTHLEILEANINELVPPNFWVAFEKFQKEYL